MFSSIIKDPSVKIKLCDELKDHVVTLYNDIQDKDVIPQNLNDAVKHSDQECVILVSDLKWLFQKLPCDTKSKMYKYIEMSEIVLPKPTLVPRNPQLESRIEKLKALAAEKQYQMMTKNVDTSRVKHPENSIAYEMKQMNRQLIAVFQLLVSISAGFAFGFGGIEYITGTLDLGSRIFLGLFFSFIILIAELYFLLKNLDAVPPEKPLTGNRVNINNHQHQE